MKNKARGTVASAILISALAAGSAATGPALAAPAEEIGSFTDKAGITWAMVDSVAIASRADAVTERMKRDCPDGAAGVVFSEQTGKLTVRVRKGIGNAENCARAAVAETASAGNAKFADELQLTDFSLAELERDVRELKASNKWAGARGKSIASIIQNDLEGVIEVDATDAASVGELMSAASRAVPSAIKVNANRKGFQLEWNRRNDSSPFYAGAAMWYGPTSDPSGSIANCTANFAWYRDTAVWQGTAGHCNNYGYSTYHHGGTARWAVSGDYEGVGVDAMLLKGVNLPSGGTLAANNVWFGESISTSNHDPITAANAAGPPLGSGMYINGANSGRVYGTVLKTSATVCPGSATTLLDTSGGGSNNAPITMGGDSGAPVTRWNTATSATDDQVAVAIHTCGNGYNRAGVTSVHRVNIATGGTGNSSAGVRVKVS